MAAILGFYHNVYKGRPSRHRVDEVNSEWDFPSVGLIILQNFIFLALLIWKYNCIPAHLVAILNCTKMTAPVAFFGAHQNLKQYMVRSMSGPN